MKEIVDRSKSNLKVKQRTKKKQQKNEEAKLRRNVEKELVKGANLIFGLDNGTTGSIACIIPEKQYIDYLETPSFECNDYTQEVKKMRRIDIYVLKEWFEKHIKFAKKIYKNKIKVIVILERPMVNPQRFKESGYALRAFESTLITIEMLKLDYIIIDSKKWQHHFFGTNTTQIDLKKESKKLSLEILTKYEKDNIHELDISNMKKLIESHGDGDSLLMCRYTEEKLIK